VGNTARRSPTNPGTTVHPHGRGEHANIGELGDTINGSSPRAWGTHKRARCKGGQRRFIPTGVGNTTTTTPAKPSAPVHPHGRGEHGMDRAYRARYVGSSPRAWGTRWPQAPARRSRRFIPTGVGNT